MNNWVKKCVALHSALNLNGFVFFGGINLILLQAVFFFKFNCHLVLWFLNANKEIMIVFIER